jgi:hypothetical protein
MKRVLATVLVGAAMVVVQGLSVQAASAASTAAPAVVQPAAANCGNNGTDLRPSRDEVLRRARSWLNNTQNDSGYDPVNFYGDYVPYSLFVCHTNSYGSYRQDCSGFVAMAWGLGGPGDGWWTGNLVPANSGGHTVAITQNQLAPGDALLNHVGNPDIDHVALFVRWVGGGALVYEQTPGRPRVSLWPMSVVNAYTPIRYALLANTLVSGGFGHLNLVRTNGDLGWYTHTGWSDGSFSWSPGFTAGSGWNNLEKVVGSGTTLYGIFPDGTMRWYRYDTDQGWDPSTDTVIGTGWNMFKFVVSGYNGVIYGVTYSGELMWYRYTGTPGHGGAWASDHGRTIGHGWTIFREVAAADGVFYGVRFDGGLQWSRYLTPLDGSGGDTAWANGGAQNQIGSGWLGGSCNYQAIQSGGDGRIYVIDGAGQLRWWRHLDPIGGSASWASVAPCGNYIGNGWL